MTAGRDRPYALGLASSLVAEGIPFDFIASDELESPDLARCPGVRILNLRGSTDAEANLVEKFVRVARYYARLISYATTSRAKVFHILWNNRLEYFDRLILLSYYKLLGKRIAFTVHNVNIKRRDGGDHWFNRVTLRYQYQIVDHLFVHTRRMATELQADFGVPESKVSVIPFGINDSVPVTGLEGAEARRLLGIAAEEKVLLFYGNIARYKGLDLLIEALPKIVARVGRARLVVAGRPKGDETYWAAIEQRIMELGIGSMVLKRIEYVPDQETEVFFKAADLLVLPYTFVFQSGVLFLGYSFGLPVVATNVGTIAEEVVEGKTGFMCPPKDPPALAAAILRYFDSDLYHELSARRAEVQQHAKERYSWQKVARITRAVYEQVLGMPLTGGESAR